jgi:hypothetical protein
MEDTAMSDPKEQKTFFDDIIKDVKERGVTKQDIRDEVALLWAATDSARVTAWLAAGIGGIAIIMSMVAIIIVKLKT